MSAPPPTPEDEVSKPSSPAPAADPPAVTSARSSAPLSGAHGIDPRPVASWYRRTTLPPVEQSHRVPSSPNLPDAHSGYNPIFNTIPSAVAPSFPPPSSSPVTRKEDTPPPSAQRSLPKIEGFGYRQPRLPPPNPPFGVAPGTGRWMWDMTQWVWVSYLLGAGPSRARLMSPAQYALATYQDPSTHGHPAQRSVFNVAPVQQQAYPGMSRHQLARGHLGLGPSEYFRSPQRAAQEQSGIVASLDEKQDARRAHQMMQLSGQPHPNSDVLQPMNIGREQAPHNPPPPVTLAASSARRPPLSPSNYNSIAPPPVQQRISLPPPQAPPTGLFALGHSDFERRMHSFQTRNILSSRPSNTHPPRQAPSSVRLPSNLPQFGVLLPPNMASPRVLPRVPTLPSQGPMERRMSVQTQLEVERRDDNEEEEGNQRQKRLKD